MRFESVKAHAFGPFRDETLELSPGMNVVYGPNEAGKSSWHAALYAGLCGRRRTRGKDKVAEFVERYRPWDGDTAWDVGAVIELDNGRRVELRHDLAGRGNSSARDVEIAGHDYTSEIMFDGAPDGARWLGLNRRSFVMTAFIRQAEILALLSSPSELQDALQRAASTTDRDGTASEALGRLRDFRTDFVGSKQAPTKPLRVTEEQVRSAERQLQEARNAHEDYLTRVEAVDKLAQEARDAERRLGVARAARMEEEAAAADARLRQARALHANFPAGAPRRPSEDDDIVRQVASALAAWEQRPGVHEPEGETIPALEERLTEADLHLAVNAERAAREVEKRLERARELDERFPHGRPLRPSEDDQLERRIYSALTAWASRPHVQVPPGQTVDELKEDLASVEAQLEGAGASARHQEGDVRGGLFARLLRAIRTFFAAFLRLFGVGRREPSVQPERRQALEESRAHIRELIAAREHADRRLEEDTQRARGAADNVQEAALAVGLTASDPDAAAASLLAWQKRRDDRLTEIDDQTKDWVELQQLLGEGTLDDLAEKATTARDVAVAAAARTDADALTAALTGSEPAASEEATTEQQRAALSYKIEARRRQEEEHKKAVAGVAAAEKAVAEAARLIGVEEISPDEQSEALRSWQDERSAELEKADGAIEEWEELQRILGQSSLDELAGEAERLLTEARALADKADIEDTAELPAPLTDAEFRDAEDKVDRSRTDFNHAQSQLEVFARELMDVAEAEEELAAAKGEYCRVRSLGDTLNSTISFLEQAEENVHRTVAPVLAKIVREWLPRVTDGRYTDCRVDPEKLAVEVETRDGRWRQADLLSHGTAEQVYLLLRFALARHLTSQACPLIVDDAVAASDSRRKHGLLETLLAVSESTQVILFTHEDDVCAWARRRLLGEPHRLIELDGPDR